MLNKLRIKFICINMTIVMILLCMFISIFYFSTKQSLEHDSIQMMQTISSDPFRMGRPNDLPKDVRLPYFAVQIGHNGEPINIGGGYFDLTDAQTLQEIVGITLSEGEKSGKLDNYNLRFLKTETPLGQLLVFSDMTSEQSTLNNMTKTSVLIGFAAFVMFLIVSILLANWAVRPIDKAWQQQKQFVSDASHELKTPLTVIITTAELLSSPECPIEDRQGLTENIITMSGQMRGLVESLLQLARIDAGRIVGTMEPLSLSELTQDAILPFEPVFFERGLQFQSDIAPDIHVKGNREQLRQLVDVLLDNAQKYSTPGGTTHVSLYRSRHNACILSVASPGAPLSDQEQKDIFKRFYRADKARTMNHSYGLGLSIAQETVQEHHGKIWAESRQGYNFFLAELPTIS